MRLTVPLLYLACLVIYVYALPVKTINKNHHFNSPYKAAERVPEHWRKIGEKIFQKHMQPSQYSNGRPYAKNVILFLGDGMGISTITAARIYKGQQTLNQSGEEASLEFDNFPHVSFAKTYSVDHQTPDSASTATAFLTGVKTNSGLLGLTADVKRKNCTASLNEDTHLTSIVKWAQDAGKWTGIVTTTRITHATPAAGYARVAERNWEEGVVDDVENKENCTDIAHQLVHESPGQDLRVILGGGRSSFISKNINPDGKRPDNRDLVKEWQNKTVGNSKRTYVKNKKELLEMEGKTDYLLGLFADSHMTYELERDNEQEPSISEMTEQAIKLLQRSDKGYFLLVEGGRIDHAHHDNRALRALEETIAMDKAVGKALDLTSPDDTLILVTADHSHVFTMAGYPERGSNILGLSVVDEKEVPFNFPTLSYSNGPGYVDTNNRTNLTVGETMKEDYVQLSGSYVTQETHGGEDVGVFAHGPMSHIFTGVYEQNYIAQAMAHAACIGSSKDHCNSASGIKPLFWVWFTAGMVSVWYQAIFHNKHLFLVF